MLHNAGKGFINADSLHIPIFLFLLRARRRQSDAEHLAPSDAAKLCILCLQDSIGDFSFRSDQGFLAYTVEYSSIANASNIKLQRIDLEDL